MKILVVKMSAIGDVILTLPAVNAIRNRFPHAHITWLVEEAAADIVVGHRALDRVLVSKRKAMVRRLFSKEFARGADQISSFVKTLRDTSYDMVIDFQGLLKSAAMVLLARGGQKIGFDRGMEHAEQSHLAYNVRIPAVSMEVHALERYLLLVKELGLGIQTDRVDYHLPVTLAQRRRIQSLLIEKGWKTSQPLICINPPATWPTKLWQADGFADLARRVQEQFGAFVVFTGSGADAAMNDGMCSRVEPMPVNLAGQTTLMALAALYELSDLLITTDTGPMHLCAATGTRVIALFGPTSPGRTGPYGPGHVVLREDLSCSPCFKRSCPLGTTECMKSITVEKVLLEVGNLIG